MRLPKKHFPGGVWGVFQFFSKFLNLSYSKRIYHASKAYSNIYSKFPFFYVLDLEKFLFFILLNYAGESEFFKLIILLWKLHEAKDLDERNSKSYKSLKSDNQKKRYSQHKHKIYNCIHNPSHKKICIQSSCIFIQNLFYCCLRSIMYNQMNAHMVKIRLDRANVWWS